MDHYLYETIRGDTFDMIALDFYNEETFASILIQANPEHRTILVFDAGVKLKIPIVEEQASETLPPWKR